MDDGAWTGRAWMRARTDPATNSGAGPPGEAWSASSGVTRAQALAFAAAGLALGICALATPGPTLFGACLVAALGFLALCALRLAAALAPPVWAQRRALPDERLPQVSVLIALYREAEIARDLVRAMEALDYPRDRLEIVFALEADDADTAAALIAARPPPWAQLVICPPGAPRTKPRALNHALAQCRGDLISIFDAEDRPDPAPPRARMLWA